MTFIYGLLTATVAIIAAEIALDYSLGDNVKDLFLKLRGKSNILLQLQTERLNIRLAQIEQKIKGAL